MPSKIGVHQRYLLFTLSIPWIIFLSVLNKPVESKVVDRPKCKLKGWDTSLDIWSPRNWNLSIIGGICNILASRTIWLYLEMPTEINTWLLAQDSFLLALLHNHREVFCDKFKSIKLTFWFTSFYWFVSDDFTLCMDLSVCILPCWGSVTLG